MNAPTGNPRCIYHLDCNFVSLRPEFVRDQLARVAAMGYDTILWELEDQVRWETCPECATPDSWSKEEFKDLLRLSRSLGLEAVPLLQTVGHGEYVMKHERYHSFREDPDFSDCYCVSNGEVRSFLKQWIAEICDLFGEVSHFHLGGDEAYRFGTCKHCVEQERNSLYATHLDDISAILRSRGIRPGIWHDMILAHPATIHRIPKDFLLWDWNYRAGAKAAEDVQIWGTGMVSAPSLTAAQRQQFPQIVDSTGQLNPFYTTDFLIEQGYDVILCSAARAYQSGPFCPNVAEHAHNIVAVAAKTRAATLFGQCVTSWAIRLNPVLAGTPLYDLPRRTNRNPDIPMEETAHQSFAAHLGFEKAWEAAKNLGVCDYRVRILSAVQWSGLKDSIPAPPRYLENWILRWVDEKESFWSEREAMFANMIDSTRVGLDLLLPHAPKTMLGTLWARAGRVQLSYLQMLNEVLCMDPARRGLPRELRELGAEITGFYASEQNRASAEANAALIVDPLIEYVEDRA